MENDRTVYVGLDVHKDSIVAAYSVGLGEVHSLGDIGVLERGLDRLCARMQNKASHVCFVYEVGPCGYGLPRPQGIHPTTTNPPSFNLAAAVLDSESHISALPTVKRHLRLQSVNEAAFCRQVSIN